MGLFSKKPSLKDLKDETVKKYYEIIYGMLRNTTWYGNESADEDSRAHKYVEYVLGGPCDEKKLKDAVELINISRTNYPSTKLENELKEYNKELRTLNKYTCDRLTAYKVCYPELVEEVKLKYNQILDVVKDYDDVKHFCFGIHKQISESESWKQDLVNDCFYISMRDSLLEGNPVTIKNLFTLFTDVLYRRKNQLVEYDVCLFIHVAISFALHALQFEKYGKNRDEYVTLSLEDFQKAVMRFPLLVKDIEKHPFEKEQYAQQHAEKIQEASAFNMYYSSYYKQYLYFEKCFVVDEYFDDALCYYVWKEIAKEYVGSTNENGDDISKSRDPIDIVNMLYDYLNNVYE